MSVLTKNNFYRTRILKSLYFTGTSSYADLSKNIDKILPLTLRILTEKPEEGIPRLAINTEIKISSLGDKAELIGAAALVMENYDKMINENLSKRACMI